MSAFLLVKCQPVNRSPGRSGSEGQLLFFALDASSAKSKRRPLFGMRNNVENNEGIAFDSKVESPISVHSGLPFVFCLAVLFGMERWVVQVGNEKTQLLFKGLPYIWRNVFRRVNCGVRKANPHAFDCLRSFPPRTRISFFKKAIASSALSNGP